MGRLTLLRSVIINLNAEYRWHSPIGINGARSAPNRDLIWRDWYVFFLTTSEMQDSSRFQRQPMTPMLVSLYMFLLVERWLAQMCSQVYNIVQ